MVTECGKYMIPGMESVLEAKKGEILKMKTQYGTHIVKVTDVTKAMKKMQVAIMVKEAVASKATYSDYYAKANEIASKSEGNIEKFNAAAKEMNAPVYPAIRVLPGAKTWLTTSIQERFQDGLTRAKLVTFHLSSL